LCLIFFFLFFFITNWYCYSIFNIVLTEGIYEMKARLYIVFKGWDIIPISKKM